MAHYHSHPPCHTSGDRHGPPQWPSEPWTFLDPNSDWPWSKHVAQEPKNCGTLDFPLIANSIDKWEFTLHHVQRAGVFVFLCFCILCFCVWGYFEAIPQRPRVFTKAAPRTEKCRTPGARPAARGWRPGDRRRMALTSQR